MHKQNKQIIQKLNYLADLAVTAREGYENTMKNVSGVTNQMVLMKVIKERIAFSYHLKSLMKKLGGKTTNELTSKEKLNLLWLDIKILYPTFNRNSLLEKCIKRDQASLKSYEVILDKLYITGDIRLAIHEQHTSIENAIISLSELLKISSLNDMIPAIGIN